ncbi:hypothetical protein ACTMTI_39810 [Nonomuraea sp. H19]|uniref:hypothetical protein n=1 Tax=Nonomuraea sp. H19 TaxID=3452206 RepID=UPI003F89B467
MISSVTARLASAALLAILAALPAPASAAKSGYTPEQVCGSGFGKVTGGTHSVIDRNGIVRGHVHLLYNAHTGENCVVTIKSSFVGQPTQTKAVLYRQVAGTNRPDKFEDAGAYRYYAGPVKAQAKGVCVLFRGWISSVPEDTTDTGIQAFGGAQSYGNCGGQDRRRKGNS